MTKVYQLTHEHLLEALDFNPATGMFVWKVARSNRVKIGSRAGVLHHASGGRYISINNEKFMAHRLAFFYVNERWPNTDVRPLDGNYDNCAIANLKEVSRVELAHERGSINTNTSGFAGVSRAKYGKWQAKITWNYKQVNLGASFNTAEDASEMYEEAARRLKEGVTTPEDRERVLAELNLWRRQRTAWKHLARSHEVHGWDSFEAFCADVTDTPQARYAMIAVDFSRPIGPGNFRWALPMDAEEYSGNPRGRASWGKARRELNQDHERNKQLRRDFGIDLPRYQAMLMAQKGVCAICDKPETKIEGGRVRMLSVDHNHTTGAVRGLLCANCNMALGFACDDPVILRKAIAYLKKYEGQPSEFDLSVTAAVAASPHRDWLHVATLGFGA